MPLIKKLRIALPICLKLQERIKTGIWAKKKLLKLSPKTCRPSRHLPKLRASKAISGKDGTLSCNPSLQISNPWESPWSKTRTVHLFHCNLSILIRILEFVRYKTQLTTTRNQRSALSNLKLCRSSSKGSKCNWTPETISWSNGTPRSTDSTWKILS